MRQRRQPLRAGRAHVVRVEHREHLDAHDAGEHGGGAEREGDDGKDVGLRPFAAGDRQQLKLHAEDVDERDAEQEVGDRRDEHAAARESEFESATAPAMRGDGDGDPDRHADRRRRARNARKARDAVAGSRCTMMSSTGTREHDRGSEVAGEQRPAGSAGTAARAGQVEAEVLAPLGDERRRRRSARAPRGSGSPGTRWIMRNDAVTSTHSETSSRPARRMVKRTQRFSLSVRISSAGRATAVSCRGSFCSVRGALCLCCRAGCVRASAEHPDAGRLDVADDLRTPRSCRRSARRCSRTGRRQRPCTRAASADFHVSQPSVPVIAIALATADGVVGVVDRGEVGALRSRRAREEADELVGAR